MDLVEKRTLIMKIKGFIVLFLIFAFMFFLNSITPMLNEDYFAAFVWPKGVANLGLLPDNVQRVSSFSDVLENLRVYYLTEGGRIPGGTPGTIFSWLGKEYFNPLNSLVMILLVMEIYWLSHEGKVTFDFNPSYLVWIFFSLWSFNVVFVDTCLWMSGSSNYLWMLVIVFAFLIPYIHNFYDENFYSENNVMTTIKMFILGILAGWSQETTVFFVILILLYWLYICKKQNALQKWKISGFIGLCTGYMLLILAPGNFSRLNAATQGYGAISASELYIYKLTGEVASTFVFHCMLWFFILSVFYRQKDKIFQENDIVKPYLRIAKSCSIIAFGSGVLMFLIPAPGWRTSFWNLAFLVVAVSSLFRLLEVSKIPLIHKKEKKFLKFVGYSYLILTMMISVWGNYNNWKHWNEVLASIHQEQKRKTNTIISVHPYYTDNNIFYNLGSGFHLIYMPVVYGDENNRINATLAKYYGIKGISKRYSN